MNIDFLNYPVVFSRPRRLTDVETVAKLSVIMGSRGTIQMLTLAAIPVERFIEMLKR